MSYKLLFQFLTIKNVVNRDVELYDWTCFVFRTIAGESVE